ncbi:tetratricopeptide repeat protein [Peribacillus sp. SCS-155]|uniref:tetratricopeptide repeat protein n=1 Tax=Peribacillus sedimenti TaxID=3115297 RepID=UPI003905ECDF
MNMKLSEALMLRKEQRYKESNEILVALTEKYPENGTFQYQCAWSFDVMGKETEAVPYYEKAISLDLTATELAGAYIGLGSTYRTIGDYTKSYDLLKRATTIFPENQALKVFLAMTLHNLGRYSDGMQILLTLLADTSADTNIQNYKRAISFYADKLDETWS